MSVSTTPADLKPLFLEERGYGGRWKKVGLLVGVLAIAFCIYQVLSSLFFLLPSGLHRIVHFTFAAVLSFLIYPISKDGKRPVMVLLDVLLITMSIAAAAYMFVNFTEIQEGGRMGAPNQTDILFGIIVVLITLEITRRVIGYLMPLVALAFIAYAYFGEYIPGVFGHRGYDLDRIVSTMYLGVTGIFGVPLGVSATFVFLFVLFGSLLEKTGGGSFFTDAAYAFAGRMRSGPAQTAVIGSATMGMISGSAVANVVTVGTFTIPLMKKMGYAPNFAGAVEAVASTGGQFMPPVMGTTAFLIAEFLQIPYSQVAIAAIIPALFYYYSLGAAVHFESGRLNMRATPKDQLPNLKLVLKDRGIFILPLAILVVIILKGYSIMTSGLIAIAMTMLSSFIYTAKGLKQGETFARMGRCFVLALKDASVTMLTVASACACAGIIIGSVGLTGLGTKISSFVIAFSGGHLFPALILCAVASLILGMGLVAVACYVLLAILVAPALIKMGTMPLAAHLFIFYFGMLSFITPPVAIAAYAAAGVANSDPFKTGFVAFRLAVVGFVVPFIMIYNPSFLMIGEPLQIIYIVISALVGITFIAAGFIGFLRDRCNVFQRIMFIAGGFLLLIPGVKTDLIGLLILAVALIINPKSLGLGKKSKTQVVA